MRSPRRDEQVVCRSSAAGKASRGSALRCSACLRYNWKIDTNPDLVPDSQRLVAVQNPAQPVCGPPLGFPAYARVMYSVDVGDDQSATWGECAAAAGVKLLPGTPFWHLSIDEGVRSNTLLCGERPEYISDDEVFALVTILAKHTQSPDDCVFGVWDGYGMPEDGARYSADTPDDHAWASAMGDRDAEDSEDFGDD